jgi:hypothetical protein
VANASHTGTAAIPQDMLQPAAYWSAQCIEGFARAQKLQFEALEVQSAIVKRTQVQAAAMARELWDQWIARWGGGVRIDG